MRLFTDTDVCLSLSGTTALPCALFFTLSQRISFLHSLRCSCLQSPASSCYLTPPANCSGHGVVAGCTCNCNPGYSNDLTVSLLRCFGHACLQCSGLSSLAVLWHNTAHIPCCSNEQALCMPSKHLCTPSITFFPAYMAFD